MLTPWRSTSLELSWLSCSATEPITLRIDCGICSVQLLLKEKVVFDETLFQFLQKALKSLSVAQEHERPPTSIISVMTWFSNRLFYIRDRPEYRLSIPKDSTLIRELLHEFHDSMLASHTESKKFSMFSLPRTTRLECLPTYYSHLLIPLPLSQKVPVSRKYPVSCGISLFLERSPWTWFFVMVEFFESVSSQYSVSSHQDIVKVIRNQESEELMLTLVSKLK
jgi:hypothetical protein